MSAFQNMLEVNRKILSFVKNVVVIHDLVGSLVAQLIFVYFLLIIRN